MLELQSQPRVLRHSLSLTRLPSENGSARSNEGATAAACREPRHRAAGSHSALFATARALGDGRSGGTTSFMSASEGSAQRTASSAGPSSSRSKLPQPQTGYPGAAKITLAAPTPIEMNGVSAAFMLSFLAKHHPEPACTGEDELAPSPSTREVGRGLKRRMKDAEENGAHTESLMGQLHPVTGGEVAGSAGIYVAHAWDSDFQKLVEAIVVDAQGDLDKRFFFDVFSTDLHTADDENLASVQRRIALADKVLLIVDKEGVAFRRLWVIFEALLSLQCGKLQVRCAASEGFGDSEASLKAWEALIDTADWALAETSRKLDEKRLRAFAEKEWEAGGRGVERMLAQLRKALRQDIYGQILMSAVKKGDKKTVVAALDLGADPEVEDGLGNTAESLAAFDGRKDIEDILFERRMRTRFHPSLSEWALDPQQLASSDQAGWFVTEFLGGQIDADEGRDSDEEQVVAGELLRLSEQSTATPHLSSRDESSHEG